ncbi:MAG: DNA topoisomerase VI subunit B [Nanoarchaeota archaeon]|nr:DNA topoisomerase VI subunit B [Nanoarchaeota archaeon]|tara:strand:- start:690 stop:2384 length:1695 start_codon:yes stop_codon:yes gene_type:complete
MAQVHAEELAKKQREISIAEFFEKNRHLLGFDNPRKALLTTIKEAVDNSLDACEEARILPEIQIEIIQLSESKFRVVVEDNGPGVVKAQVPKIFAKLLYGSKFHKMAQSRGQQGIGISAAALYGQLTTGKGISILTKIGENTPATSVVLKINTSNNKPEIVEDKEEDWPGKKTGVRIELDLEGSYIKGKQSVDEYIKQTAVVNPHCTIIYTNPDANQFVFARVTDDLPVEAKEIKPHPYGVELGMLLKMATWTTAKTLQQFLTSDFTRVSARVAKQICEEAALLPKMRPKRITREHAEKLMEGIKKTKIIAPPTDCLSPIGEELLEKGLRKEINAEFYCSNSRKATVYRGNPFMIEAALAYGGEQDGDKSIRIMRFANRVPLLYQQSACGITNAVQKTIWRQYGLQQSRNSIPVGPLTLVVHMSSVWVPFTSESKEALAHYTEILKEVKLAISECGRKLGMFIRKKKRIQAEGQKRSYIEKYIPHVAEALVELIGLTKIDGKKIEDDLGVILEHTRGELEEIKIDNPEYDAEFAKIGKVEKNSVEKSEVEKSEKSKKVKQMTLG